MERFTIERRKLKELEEKIEEFLKERGRIREALFNELEGAVRKRSFEDKLLGLFSDEIETWKVFLRKFGVPEQEINDILSTATRDLEKTEEKQ